MLKRVTNIKEDPLGDFKFTKNALKIYNFSCRGPHGIVSLEPGQDRNVAALRV